LNGPSFALFPHALPFDKLCRYRARWPRHELKEIRVALDRKVG
jgi:hypothetical protein